jgi:hypothetical protein
MVASLSIPDALSVDDRVSVFGSKGRMRGVEEMITPE